ncbi:MAG TPA: hypothetical protein VF746_27385 [Longimicrobium sp.]|jgi:hypothetical protein
MSRIDQTRRAPDEPGSRSPASREAKEQGMSGHQGGPRSEQAEGSGESRQAAQGTQRVENPHEPEVRKGFAAGQAPSEQGRGSPKPDTIAEHQQGIGAKSGSTGAHDTTSAEEAARGEPHDTHVRDGRQHTPGDRQRD